MTAVIELENVTKTYQSGEVAFNALNGVSLKINNDEFIGIVGPSGSGKSTLLHIIGCLDKPTSGKVYLDGKDISKLNETELAKLRAKKIGFVFQFFNLYPSLTAMQNVELPMMIVGVDKKERRDKALELLKMVGLEKRVGHLPSQLSGGESQRVAIARALANNPKIILADEPTGNLDTKSGQEIVKMLKDLNINSKITLAIITHDHSIVKDASRLIRIKDGKIEEE